MNQELVNPVDPEQGWDQEAQLLSSHDPELVFVKGSHGPLCVGVDDIQIKREHHLNLAELEQETAEEVQIYVATLQQDSPAPHSTPDRKVLQTVDKPHNIVLAKTMRDAITTFEKANNQRYWLPDGDMFTCQIGIGRVAKSGLVRLYKVRKDCVVGQSVQLVGNTD